jgi:hypothetical protein
MSEKRILGGSGPVWDVSAVDHVDEAMNVYVTMISGYMENRARGV